MTRKEFEDLMEEDGWPPDHRWQWRRITPLCDAATFRREMAKSDGFIEFRKEETGDVLRRAWKRFWRDSEAA
jgi:hypothetical protein